MQLSIDIFVSVYMFYFIYFYLLDCQKSQRNSGFRNKALFLCCWVQSHPKVAFISFVVESDKQRGVNKNLMLRNRNPHCKRKSITIVGGRLQGILCLNTSCYLWQSLHS